MHYQSLFTRCSSRNMAKSKTLPVYIFSASNFFLLIFNRFVTLSEPRQANLCLQAFRHDKLLTAHAQPFRGAMGLAFCLKVPLDSLLLWASSEGSGETARMRRLAWTFAARIGDKYQIRLTRSIYKVLRTKRSWFHKVCTINHYLLGAATVVETWLS